MTGSQTARTAHRIVTTDDQIDAAIAEGRMAAERLPRAVAATYNAAAETIAVTLSSGVTLIVPRALLEGLDHGTPEQLAAIEILGPGTGLHWPLLDVDHYLTGLIQGIFGTQQWMTALQRQGAQRYTGMRTVSTDRS
ncbi:MAG: DUF2442 domain-containing protein [Dehalococcoidia bacterium]